MRFFTYYLEKPCVNDRTEAMRLQPLRCGQSDCPALSGNFFRPDPAIRLNVKEEIGIGCAQLFRIPP